jgi:transposase InsO family protein
MSFRLNTLYRVVGISKQAIWAQAQREAQFAIQREALLLEVDQLLKEHGGCGLEKMYYTLKPDFLGRDRFIALLQELGYGHRQVHNSCRTTYAGNIRYPNLIEGLLVYRPNQVWQSDITYLRVQEDFYYAVFLIDVYTKRIVGFQVSDHMYAEANLAALKQALKLRRNQPLAGLIHHSDRGSQYGAKLYTRALENQEIAISMGLHAQGNAYVERVNGTIKNEYLAYRFITTFAQLKREVVKAVKHYNERRIHNALPGKISPIQLEQQLDRFPGQARPFIVVHAYDRPDYQWVKPQKLSSLIPMEKNVLLGICPLINHPYFFNQNGQL